MRARPTRGGAAVKFPIWWRDLVATRMLLGARPGAKLQFCADGSGYFQMADSEESALEYLRTSFTIWGSNGQVDWARLLEELGNLGVEYIEEKMKMDKEKREAGEVVNNHPKIKAFLKKYHVFKPRRCERRASNFFYAGHVFPHPPWWKGMKEAKYLKLINMLGIENN